MLLREALEGLALRDDGWYVDATYGRGGHSAEILARLGPQGRLLALDKDPDAVAHGADRFAADARFTIRHAGFEDLDPVAAPWLAGRGLAGILFDLGVSSPQLDQPARGFSFAYDGPLDMRTLGELAALPAAAVADRFGQPGLRALRLARGVDEPLRPRRPHEEIECRLGLPEAASGPQLEQRARPAHRAPARPSPAARDGRSAGCGSRRGSPGTAAGASEVTLRSAAVDPERLRLALAPRLASCPGPAAWLGLRAVELGPEAGEQQALAHSPDSERRGRLAEAVRQARSAGGRDAVMRVVEVDPGSRVPERRAILTPFGDWAMAEPRPQVYWPLPVAGAGERRRRAARRVRRRGRGGARAVAGRGPLVDPETPAKKLFRGRPRRRSQRRRLPRAGGAGHGGALVRAAGVTDGRLRRAARPFRVLVRRRRLAARGARHPRRRVLLSGPRAHRPRQRLRGDGVRPGVRRAGGAADRGRGAHGG